jgi:Tol biopolymer transport system component
MGEVYRAIDTRLGRAVAIKIAATQFSERFGREARAISALNHPHICTLYDVGPNYLVMELVEGSTLGERIKKGAISLEEALAIARQIADALDAAHEKGITHRDLKPGNVKIKPDGTVKVLDFGLAKIGAAPAIETENSPTLTMTEEGVILGTASYMSPEQAQGKHVDRRADIYAFGAVLYEMLTGERLHRGKTTTEVLASVIKDDPRWERVPAQVQRLLRRCLVKDPQKRLRHIGDAMALVDDVPALVPVTTKPRGRRRMIVAAALACALAAAAALAGWLLKPTTPKPVTRLAMSLPPGQRLALDNLALAISPDGTRLAYVALQGSVSQVYLRAMDSLEARAIPGTDGAGHPFFSPDGQWIGFSAGGKLKKVSLSGGAPISLTDVTPRGIIGASWGSQGVIAFTQRTNGPIQQVSDAGGNVQPLTRLAQGESSHGGPWFLPGGKGLLFNIQINNVASNKAAVQSPGVDGHRDLRPVAGDLPRYTPSGHIVYLQGTNLMAVPFDLRNLAVTGTAVPVVEGVLPLQYSFSSTGSLVYSPGSIQTAQLKLVWVDRKGAEQPVPAPAHIYVMPRVSPDGQRVAAGIEEEGNQIWLYDFARDTLTRLTFEGASNTVTVWTPDGKRIVFKGAASRLFWQAADGSGAVEPLTNESLAPNNFPGGWSPDGQTLVFVEQAPSFAIWLLPLKDRKPQPFGQSRSDETAPRFSPDGHWIAYRSNESGRNEVYIRPYPGPGGKWQISTEGGTEPVWNPKGGELFYRNGSKMMAVDVVTQPTLSAGKPRMLFEGAYVLSPRSSANYDVSPDGQRFLMVEASEQGQAPAQINVVLNWFEELKRRVPNGTK